MGCESKGGRRMEGSESLETERPRVSLATKLRSIPLVFLGLALYRAWIEIVFVGSFVPYPIETDLYRDVFDLSSVAMMLAIAFLAKTRNLTFESKGWWIAGAVCMTASTVGIMATLFLPQTAVLALPCAAVGGVGVSIAILVWSNLYSCINPIRVALYYSASIAAAALVVYVYMGFKTPWLAGMTLLLPIGSFACAISAFRTIPDEDLPKHKSADFSFPWKPALLMSLYSLAYGMTEKAMYDQSVFGPHSSFGVLLIGALIFLGVAVRGERFDFGAIYRFALPAMMAALLVVPNLSILDSELEWVCSNASYTAFSILIMVLLATISHQRGVSALFLFGIERAVRSLFMLGGRAFDELIPSLGFSPEHTQLILAGTTIALIAAFTTVIVSEKDLFGSWGITFLGQKEISDVSEQPATDASSKPAQSAQDAQRSPNAQAIVRKQELAERCAEVSQEHGLTNREQQILLLLAQHKTISAIEHELFVANGTVKAHVRHIYRKLDIHSREELFQKLSLFE